MGVDSSYGSGYKNTGLKKPVAPKAASAKLRKKGIRKAGKKYTSITTAKAKMLPGTSDYVTQENAARKQLGVAGLAARNRQLPTAARAFVKEMSGIDISRKGVSVDPIGLAMALPLGKVLKAASYLRGAGRLAEASMLEARNVSKLAGRAAGKRIAIARNPATSFGVGRGGSKSGEMVLSDWIRGATSVGGVTRKASEGVFPRIAGAGTTVRRGVGTVNQKGLEKMIAGGREPSREMLRIPQILKGTNEAYESIAQKAIKAAGKTPKKLPKNRGGR